MGSGPNHRRGHDRVKERGPRYENGNPAAGCNSTHVAKGRKKWKTIGRREKRREGKRIDMGEVQRKPLRLGDDIEVQFTVVVNGKLGAETWKRAVVTELFATGHFNAKWELGRPPLFMDFDEDNWRYYEEDRA